MKQALELLPLRAINAHTFCPRLFWLEHVEGIFTENVHTIEGSAVHRRVDQKGGVLAAPNEEDEPWQSRSLWLSDEELGINGKLDFVDQMPDQTVLPVDTKKGYSRSGELWAPDLVQLALQALLLQRAGYKVSQIAAYYASERRRVYEDLSPQLIKMALQALEDTQKTLRNEKIPSPLLNARQCEGCSLYEVCLPDEVNRIHSLKESSKAFGDVPLRRVLPPRFDTIPLHVHTTGATVRKKGNEVEVVTRDGNVLLRHGLETLSDINLYGYVNITTPLLLDCLDRDIPVCFFSSGGWYRGRSKASMNRQVDVRLEQFEAYRGQKALTLASTLIADKIHNCRVFIRRNQKEKSQQLTLKALKQSIIEAEKAKSPESLLGIEGYAAKLYFASFSQLIEEKDHGFLMKGRTRRPPRDEVNAMLSYIYGMLTKDCSLAVEKVGLDPHLGLYHTPHHGRPSMALDLMEPFRPLIADSVVFGLISRKEVKTSDFVRAGQEVYMKKAAKFALIKGYERRMDELVTHPLFDYSVSYRRVLYLHARLISRFLKGEIADPPQFRTR